MSSRSHGCLAGDSPSIDFSCFKIGFIGAGKMAQALITGITKAGLIDIGKIWASAPSFRNLNTLKDQGVAVTTDNKQLASVCDIIILAVKPHMLTHVLQGEVAEAIESGTLVLSLVTGIKIEKMEQMLPSNVAVIRCMPNTPAAVGVGVTAIARGNRANDTHMRIATSILTSVGICEEVPEYLIDTVTGMCGSGPAYIYTVIDSLADGGVKMGLNKQTAIRMAAYMVMGAAKMVLETGEHPGKLKDDVCSPGGTTIHGLHEIEKGGVRAAIINAVEAATLRGRELGKQ